MEEQEKQESLYSKVKSNVNSLTQTQKYTVFGFVFLLLLFTLLFFHSYPKDFPVGQVVTIESGESLQAITNNLYNGHIVGYPFIFRTTVILLGGEKRVIAGDYLLDQKEGPIDLAYRLVNGKFHLDTIKMTIPEGWNVFQIGDYLEKNMVHFDKKSFENIAKVREGYLFPDTYFISPTEKPKAIVERMSQNFGDKILTVPGIATSTRNLKEIIIVASILEEEARTTQNRRIVAGILWKRLKLGMPLQVDSTFSYINGKNTYELTVDDLKIDSPYNTYVYKGLPPGPISNPGVDAIFSAINPVTTKYLYFLSSKSGTMYYATTFDEHKKNKELYLYK